MAFAWLASLTDSGVAAEKVVKIIALAAEAAGQTAWSAGRCST